MSRQFGNNLKEAGVSSEESNNSRFVNRKVIIGVIIGFVLVLSGVLIYLFVNKNTLKESAVTKQIQSMPELPEYPLAYDYWENFEYEEFMLSGSYGFKDFEEYDTTWRSDDGFSAYIDDCVYICPLEQDTNSAMDPVCVISGIRSFIAKDEMFKFDKFMDKVAKSESQTFALKNGFGQASTNDIDDAMLKDDKVHVINAAYMLFDLSDDPSSASDEVFERLKQGGFVHKYCLYESDGIGPVWSYPIYSKYNMSDMVDFVDNSYLTFFVKDDIYLTNEFFSQYNDYIDAKEKN